MLKVKIYSFSYKKSGIPKDETPNAGGFVFDCRFIYNPGREEKFKNLTGKDKEVIEFMDKDVKMEKFLDNVFSMVDEAVDNYTSRDFSSLMVSFGCTGGQHRSIYASEKLKEHLLSKYNSKIQIALTHSEFPELSSNP
jgi:RNase adaptor protein for sRNA GlmZ degradation